MSESQSVKVILSSSADGELIRYVERCLLRHGEAECLVTVSEDSYRRWSGKGRLGRALLRGRMYLWHPLRLCWHLLCSRSDSLWIVTTNPFFAPALASLVARIRGQKVIHLLYDLFPDALEEAGLVARDGLVSKILGLSTRAALRRSYLTVFLGDRLAAHAQSRWGKVIRAAVIPVVLSEPISERPECGENAPIEIHYGGQLGWMHDADRLAKLVRAETLNEVASRRVRWSFLISGARANRFREYLQDSSVEIGTTLSVRDWRQRAVGIQVGLVSLSEGGARVCLPSKTFGMMACGMAILALCPSGSDLGRLIASNQLGWVVDNYDGRNSQELEEEFLEVVTKILTSPEELLHRRQNAWDFIAAQNRIDDEGKRWGVVFDLGKSVYPS